LFTAVFDRCFQAPQILIGLQALHYPLLMRDRDPQREKQFTAVLTRKAVVVRHFRVIVGGGQPARK